MKPTPPPPVLAMPPWMRRLGFGGVAFFLAKGLLWLTLPAMLALSGLE